MSMVPDVVREGLLHTINLVSYGPLRLCWQRV